MEQPIDKWTIGSTTLTSIVEAQTDVAVGLLLPDATPDDVCSAGSTHPKIAADDGSTIRFGITLTCHGSPISASQDSSRPTSTPSFIPISTRTTSGGTPNL